MEVPVRAVWARTLLAELNRVLNHLMFLGSYPIELGAITPIFYAFRERETLQAVMEEVSGGRMHYMFNRVGGLKEELPAGWTRPGRARRSPTCAGGCPTSRTWWWATRSSAPAPAGSGSCRRELVHAVRRERADRAGLGRRLGPAPGRALPRLRRAATCPVVTRTAGDCLARFECLLEQAHVSLDLADACVDRLRSLPPGPINVRLPKVLKVPEGSTYAWTENPLGINGYYLVSRGEKTPWRLKLRSASFNNVQALSELLPGTLIADMVAILGSMFFVVGDVDK